MPRNTLPRACLIALACSFISTAEASARPDDARTDRVAVAIAVDGRRHADDGLQFHYAAPPSIAAFRPALGPEAGGTRVTIHGSGFSAAAPLLCDFGGEAYRVPAAVLDAETAHCTSPPHAPGSVSLRVTYDGQEFAGAPSAYEYHGLSTVYRVEPARVSVRGGAELTVFGSGFPEAGAGAGADAGAVCRVGEQVVRALSSSATEVRCVAPASAALAPGRASVSVSFNRQDYAASAAGVEYVAAVAVTGLSPSTGLIDGGTAVAAAVDGALSIAHVACVFGERTSAATVDGDGRVVCATPGGAGPGRVSFGIRVGSLYVGSEQIFTYAPRPTVSRVHPPSGSEDGGSTAFVVGSGFARTKLLSCRFGADVLVAAVWMSSTVVTCKAPALAPGLYAVSVTLNGQEFSLEPVPFTVRAATTVHSFSPIHGHVGSAVSVRGTGFVEPMWCRFGEATVPARRVPDSTTALCVAPSTAVGAPDAVPVAVAMRDAPFISAPGLFTYRALPRATGLRPNAGSLHGGTVATVTGANFANTDKLSCLFGGVHAPATWTSTSELRCVTPAATSAGPVAVAIAVDGRRHADDGLQFHYAAPPSIAAFRPALGPEAGGTRVTIHGSGFSAAAPLLCDFGGEAYRVPAAVLDAETAHCTSPPHAPGSVSLRVTYDGQEFAGAPSAYEYHGLSTVYRVEPARVSVRGGAELTVFGSGFPEAGAGAGADAGAVCRVGEQVVRALSSSATEVRCVAPASAALAPGRASVSVSFNRQDYAASAAGVEYVAAVAVTGLSPSHGTSIGGTTIRVTTDAPMDPKAHVVALVGGVRASAKVAGPQEVALDMPAGVPGPVHVALEISGIRSRNSLPFIRAAPLTVSSITPAEGIESGGTTVIVAAEGIDANFDTYCRFGAAGTVPATKLAGGVSCVSPAASAGLTRVDLTSNGQDFSANGMPFEYLPVPSLQAAGPLSGSTTGGTRVSLKGTNLRSSLSLVCEFGKDETAATVLSDTEAFCATPAQRRGAVPFRVLLAQEGEERVLHAARFVFGNVARITGASPEAGPPSGGTEIRVTLGGAWEEALDGAFHCAFRSSLGTVDRVSAEYVGGGAIQCETPPTPARRLVVSVESAAIDRVHGSIGFAIQDVPTIESISIQAAFSTVASVITVAGHGFAAGPSLACKAEGVGGAENLGAVWVSAGSIECVVQPDRPGELSLRVTNNGQQLSNAVPLNVLPRPVISGLSPAVAYAEGGASITITGRYFPPATERRCTFGARAVPGHSAKDDEVVCQLPPFASGLQGIAVGVLFDGVEAAAARQLYLAPLPRVHRVAPRSVPYSGGTSVVVSGTGLSRAGCVPECRLDNGEAVPAAVRAGGSISFVAPAARTGAARAAAGRPSAFFADTLQVRPCPAMPWVPSGQSIIYEERPVVSRVDPPSAFEGTVNLTLHGAGFKPSGALACRLFGTLGTGKYLSPLAMSCAFDFAAPNVGVLEITLNGIDFFAADAAFQVHDFARLSAIQPSTFPLGRPTAVEARGAGFHAAATAGLPLLCASVGTDDAVRAVFVSDSKVFCPGFTVHSPGKGAFAIVAERHGPMTNELPIESFRDAIVESLSPRRGAARGGTRITLEGSGFAGVSRPMCVFRSLDGAWQANSTADVKSDGQASCATPAMPAPTAHSAMGAAAFVAEVAFTSASQIGQLSAIRRAWSFAFTPAIEVSAFSPTIAYADAPVSLSLRGSGWREDDEPACRLGAVEGTATINSAREIECSVAALAPGVHSVSVSLNGVDYTEAGEPLVVHEGPLVTSPSPPVLYGGGRATLDLSGSGFRDVGAPACMLNGTWRVPALIVSDARVSCEVDLSTVRGGSLSVAMSNAHGIVSRSSVGVEVLPVPRLEHVAPLVAVVGDKDGAFDLAFTASAPFGRGPSHCRIGASPASPVRLVLPGNRFSQFACSVSCPSVGEQALELSLDGMHFSATSTQVSCVDAPSNVSISPASGPIRGGTSVEVSGSGIPAAAGIACRFGARRTAAVWVSSFLVKCEAPASSSGPQVVDVTLEAGMVTLLGSTPEAGALSFAYEEDAVVTSVMPTALQHGGTVTLDVEGAGFKDSPLLRCSIGALVLPASFVNERRVRVTTRAALSGLAGADGLRRAPVAVSNNGQDFGGAVGLVILSAPRVDAVLPQSVMRDSATAVTVVGGGFEDTKHLACRFPRHGAGKASFVSSTEILCVPPAGAFAEVGTVALEVSNDGASFRGSARRLSVLGPVLLERLEPSGGPLAGGTAVRLVLQRPFASDSTPLACLFGAVAVPAEATHAAASCEAPASDMPLAVRVGLAVGGFELTTERHTYTYYEDVTAVAVSPVVDNVRGGATVTVSGSRFREGSTFCAFGPARTRATVITPTSATCVVPPAKAPGAVPLSVSGNGADFHPFSNFSYVSTPVLRTVTPAAGPTKGGTVVLLEGYDMPSSAGWRCRFGEDGTSFAYAEGRGLRCTSPAVSSAGPRPIFLDSDAGASISTGGAFGYYHDPAIVALSPSRLSSAGGDVLTVSGSGFRDTGAGLTCRISSLKTAAAWLSPHTVACRAPALPVGQHAVDVSLNGHDFLPVGEVSVAELFRVRSASPSFSSTRGGSTVRMSATGLDRGAALSCRFGAQVVGAVPDASSSTISCVVPPGPVGRVELSLAQGGLSSENALDFLYHEEIVAFSVEPPHASVAGGVPIRIGGASLEASLRRLGSSASPACRFGSSVVPAAADDEHGLSCATPARAAPQTVALAVSVDGTTFSEAKAAFAFTPKVAVASVSPAAFVSGRATTFVVIGSGFWDSPDAVCKVGTVASASVAFLSPTSLSCAMPALPPGVHAAAVSMNGVEFAGSIATVAQRAFSASGLVPSVVRASVERAAVIRGTFDDLLGAADPALRAIVRVKGGTHDGKATYARRATFLNDTAVSLTLPAFPASAAGQRAMIQLFAAGVEVHQDGDLSVDIRAPIELRGAAPKRVIANAPVAVAVRLERALEADAGYACAFRHGAKELVSAARISAAKVLECISPVLPDVQERSRVFLRIIAPDGSRSPTAVALEYLPAMTFERIFPAEVPVDTGAAVHIHGAHFPRVSGLSCVLAGRVLEASYLSPGHLVCELPSMPLGAHALHVAADRASAGAFAGVLTYSGEKTVASLHPRSGPVTGGTAVTVRGTGFAVPPDGAGAAGGMHPVMVCRFGTLEVLAAVIDESTLTCPSPAFPDAAVVEVAVAVRYHASKRNDVLGGAALKFAYYEAPSAVRLEPMKVPSAVPTDVVLHGAGFRADVAYTVRFTSEEGDHEARMATVQSPDELSVTSPTPKWAAAGRRATVSISRNGQDFVDVSSTFYFEPAITITGVRPRSVPSLGGAELTVTGTNFHRAFPSTLSCDFGDGRRTLARHVTPRQLVCDSPALPEGRHGLRVLEGAALLAESAALLLDARAPLRVLSARPSEGPGRGGTSISLTVSDVHPDDHDLVCVFAGGRHIAPAAMVGEHEVRCRSPPATFEGEAVDLELAPRSQLGWGARPSVLYAAGAGRESFKYYAEETIHSLAPAFGASAGGTVVAIRGAGFRKSSPSPRCRFGFASGSYGAVAARVLSETHVECRAPAADATGVAAVHFTSNGFDYSETFATFEYVDAPSIDRLWPASGPVGASGVVTVVGSAFFEAPESTHCRFGALGRHRATYVSRTEIHCVVPRASTAQDVQVLVSLNGVDDVDAALTFSFTDGPSVYRVDPDVGQRFGGTPVRFLGANFANSSATHCAFGDQAVPATFVSSSELRCTSPARGVGSVRAAVSNDFHAHGAKRLRRDDGELWSTDPVTFSYVELPVVDRVTPTGAPQGASAMLAVAGRGFAERVDLACVFVGRSGQAAGTSPAAFRSTTALACPVPAELPDGVFRVHVSLNGLERSVDGVAIDIFAPPIVTGVAPARGQQGAGGEVTVTGSRFPTAAAPASAVACRFTGGQAVREYAPAAVLSADKVVCRAPKTLPAAEDAQRVRIERARPTPEVQVVRLGGAAPRGSFTVSHGGAAVTVPRNATGEYFEARLRSLPGLSSVTVRERQYPAHRTREWSVTFPAALGDVAALGVDAAGLSGADASLSVVEAERGAPLAHGSVTLSFGGEGTGHIALGADAATVKEALMALPTVGHVEVQVASGADEVLGSVYEDWLITFTTLGSPSNVGDQELLIVDVGAAHGGVAGVAVSKVSSGCCDVSVTFNGQDYTASTAPFKLDPEARVVGVQPSQGPPEGGTEVTISMTRLGPANALRCVFASIEVPAVLVGAGTATCVSPAHPHGLVPVGMRAHSLSAHSVVNILSAPAATFRYVPMPVPVAAFPEVADASRPTAVTLAVEGLRANVSYTCRLRYELAPATEAGRLQEDTVDVPAALGAEASTLLCATPAAEDTALLAKVDPSLRHRVACAVSVTYNGADFSGSVPLILVQSPEAATVTPVRGVSAGGTTVTVRGTGFHANGAALCRFGDGPLAATAPATAISATAVSCTAPAFLLPPAAHGSRARGGSVSLAVSNDGQHFSNALLFRYHDDVRLQSLSV